MKFISLLRDLDDKKIVLASQSPRRIELLRSVGLDFRVYPSQIEEKIIPGYSPRAYARHNASEKAHWVSLHTDYDLIIAADTVVCLHERIFEKPADRTEARTMLESLSGKTHQVISGICLLAGQQEIIDHVTTDVTFYPLSREEIDLYLQSGEPYDKAGAYGIQGFASLFIKKIDGCYFNVVGFPISRFYRHLKTIRF